MIVIETKNYRKQKNAGSVDELYGIYQQLAQQQRGLEQTLQKLQPLAKQPNGQQWVAELTTAVSTIRNIANQMANITYTQNQQAASQNQQNAQQFRPQT